MRGSNKGDAPRELMDWIAGEQEVGIEPRYGNWPRPVRDRVESYLFTEQTGQCVYCGRSIILEANQRYHIEHFRPRRYRKLEVEFSNLFLSCGPRGDEGPLETCGNGKRDWFDEHCHIYPGSEECCARFLFGSSGKIFSDGTAESAKMIQVLGLDDVELTRERAELIEEIDNELSADVPIEELIEHYSEVVGSRRVSFAHVAIRYLETEVRFTDRPSP